MNQDTWKAQTTSEVIRLVSAGSMAEAEAWLRNAMKRDPSWPDPALELANLLVRIDRSAEALEVLQGINQRHPGELRGWLLNASIHHNKSEASVAITSMKRAIVIAPENLQTQLLFRKIASEKTMQVAISTLLERILILSPNHVWSLLDHGKICLAGGLLVDAQLSIHKALILAPGLAEGSFVLGLAELKKYALQASFAWLNRAWLIVPANASCAYQACRSAFLLDKQTYAERAAREALQLGHPEVQARFMLARILRASGQIEKANHEFDRLEQIDPAAGRKRRIVAWTATSDDFNR